MSEFFKRLDKFLNYKGLNDNKITKITGISNGLIGKARERGSLSQGSLEKILNKFPELNPNWLYYGTGAMIKQKEIVNEPRPNYGIEATCHNCKSHIIEIKHLLDKIELQSQIIKILREKNKKLN